MRGKSQEVVLGGKKRKDKQLSESSWVQKFVSAENSGYEALLLKETEEGIVKPLTVLRLVLYLHFGRQLRHIITA